MIDDTIAAISTGLTNSGIGKIRLSGTKAIDIVSKLYKSPKGKKDLTKAKSHTIHYGYIFDQDQLIDEVLVLIMKAPNSYTTEDVVEIDCHGGVVVMKKLLEIVIRYGARPAEPGEFTKRAFLNGRIDLTQAEAVIDIIQSKNEYALQSSVRQLKGNIQQKIRDIRKNIIGNVAFIEAALDDPEHINADDFGSELKGNVCHNIEEIQKLLDTSDNGRIIKEGIKTAIIGKPNAGKSSLLNVLVGDERAIVTDIPGTTRDTLEEFILMNGIPLNIIDTAGIRNTQDVVEKIGVSRSKQSAQDADLVIYVVDGSQPLDEYDDEIIDLIQGKKVIIVLNKIDLEPETTTADIRSRLIKNEHKHFIIEISTKEEKGIDQLMQLVEQLFFGGHITMNDEIYITSLRHKAALEEAKHSLELVLKSIEDRMPEDFFSIDLMNAYEALGSIIGESSSEDLVNTIFSDFCMGK